MSEKKWTPGPWSVSQRADDMAAYITEKPCGSGRVAKVWMGRTAQDANAHLIAAAPDLYGALDDVGIYIDYNAIPMELSERIDAALSKARGEK